MIQIAGGILLAVFILAYWRIIWAIAKPILSICICLAILATMAIIIKQ